MTEFKFVPGEYKTRDGRRAIVRFRVQDPTNDTYPLVGEVTKMGGDGWYRCTWTDEGENSIYGPDCGDLIPPVRYCYKNCFEHDTGGRYETDPSECDVSYCAKRYGVLRLELTTQGRPDWRTVEFIPVENLEHA